MHHNPRKPMVRFGPGGPARSVQSPDRRCQGGARDCAWSCAMNVLLIGPPGSGKGTQGDRLSARLGLEHISSGDMLRAEVESGSAIGRKTVSMMQAGELVPDLIIISLLL